MTKERRECRSRRARAGRRGGAPPGERRGKDADLPRWLPGRSPATPARAGRPSAQSLGVGCLSASPLARENQAPAAAIGPPTSRRRFPRRTPARCRLKNARIGTSDAGSRTRRGFASRAASAARRRKSSSAPTARVRESRPNNATTPLGSPRATKNLPVGRGGAAAGRALRTSARRHRQGIRKTKRRDRVVGGVARNERQPRHGGSPPVGEVATSRSNRGVRPQRDGAGGAVRVADQGILASRLTRSPDRDLTVGAPRTRSFVDAVAGETPVR